MKERPSYSMRTGKHPSGGKLGIEILADLVRTLYLNLNEKGYFAESFGYSTALFGWLKGTLGTDIGAYLQQRLRKQDIWPLGGFLSPAEDDVFDIIEVLYDCVSLPEDIVGNYGPTSFDRDAARQEFRNEVNELLRDYEQGYEVSENGEIHALPEEGLAPLLEEPLPEYDPENVDSRRKAAISKFRNRHATPDERRDAVRALADVLEFLRNKITDLDVITKKDEGDLFNIANNFAIRHHSDTQKSDYDKEIWNSWMFYFYLATIHAALRLIEKKAGATT